MFAHGRRLGNGCFQLHVLPSAGPPRLGLAVSRRVDARAVVRNRIKRTARESFRRRRAQLPGGDYVLVARREAAQRDPGSLRDQLQALWNGAAALLPGDTDGTMRAAAPSRAEPAQAAQSPSEPGSPGQSPTRR